MTESGAEVAVAEKQATSEWSKNAARQVLLLTDHYTGTAGEEWRLTLPTQKRQYDATCFHILLS
eukprot:CAMPEP_0174334768 /NCGR_PEP_ID=MMETSP0810-20121108/20193_1 /TAXON_ID=73025 ORGANISM="Eutreptiella gymnastica-like, Strain CCMP1594" /NCGR_SAMPLE_ID=MMETSP0810 /ASSEMBLY_ACC=CAM_ASM_000659 /LENGTH=63 /DNA_ID=CAMNT_0015452637 /DNA_START=578 /DNA_END=765 /DNA_ORIENTATION=-